MQTIIFQILQTPYFYILLGILLIIVLCILFNKRIKSILKDINIHFKKTDTMTFEYTTSPQNSKNNIGINIKNVEIENLNAGDIEGKVSINNSKIKDSTIGSIRGR